MKPNALVLFTGMALCASFMGSTQAGVPNPGSISGTKFEDLNGDGARDAGEPGLPGITIELLNNDNGNLLQSTVTDANGDYLFDLLNPGSFYTVAEDLGSLPGLPGEIVPTTPPEITDIFVGDNGSSQVTGINFGNAILGSIHGFKFFDFNADGIYSPTGQDTPLADVVFNLTDVSLNVLDTVPTDTNGEFWFTDLLPGTYTVTETVPAGYSATTPTSWTVTLQSGQEYVWQDGAAMLDAGSLKYEVNVGADLMFGNSPISVAEPTSLALIGLGLAGFGYRRRKQIKAA